MIEAILFDLDGTLVDSEEGIINTMKKTLESYGVTAEDAQLTPFIGPPLIECFAHFLGEEHAAEATAYYRKLYGEKGIFECYVYDGVIEMLRAIKESGIPISLATSKPEPYAIRVLDHYDITKYLTHTTGAKLAVSHQTKAEVIEDALERLGSPNRDNVLMVGDRLYDMEGAKTCGVPAIGVSWGFAEKGELERYSPIFIASSPSEITDYILK